MGGSPLSLPTNSYHGRALFAVPRRAAAHRKRLLPLRRAARSRRIVVRSCDGFFFRDRVMTTSAFLYAGTYSTAGAAGQPGHPAGIHVLRLDSVSGLLQPASVTATLEPSWLAASPDGRFLYAVNEVSEFAGRPGGGVSAFAVDSVTGGLVQLNSQPTTGRLPCHCVTDAGGRVLLVAGYLDGTVELFPIAADGRLAPAVTVRRHAGSSVHPRRQAGPHAHSVTLDPAGRFLLVADLGTDRVAVYELDAAQRTLTACPERDARVEPGSGPRHLAFHPAGRFVYLVNEMAATVTAFGYDEAAGALRELQTVSALPEGFTGFRAAAEIAVHPAGRFLYVTNRSDGSSHEPAERGEDTIAWFEIDPGTGRLTPRGRVPSGGDTPRTLTISPDGSRLYVANQSAGNLTTFLIDEETGAPTAAGQVTPVAGPVSLLIAG